MRSIGKHSKEEEKDKELESAFNNFKNTIKDALTDLVTLEVNSVLVSNISADHPSDDRVFLHQTCEKLTEWFERNKIDGIVRNPLKSTSISQLSILCGKDECLESDAITPLRDDIAECLKHKEDDFGIEQRQKHAEADYRRHLRYLHKYLDLHCNKEWDWDKGMLKGREHQQLRKLWELVGTRIVYAQTVMGIDGDIVSRINDQLFTTAGDNAEELMHFHSRNVEAGANYRNGLMDTFVLIIRALIGK